MNDKKHTGYFLFSGFSQHEVKKFLSHLPENKGPIILSYGDHLPEKLIFNLNELRVNLYPSGVSIERNFFDLCLKHKAKILQLLTRQMVSYQKLSYSEIEYLYHTTILSFSEFIKNYDIDFIFSRTYPQFAFDYLLFLYCSIKKISYVFEYPVQYLNAAILCTAKLKSSKLVFSIINKKQDNVIYSDRIDAIFNRILHAIKEESGANRVSYYDVQDMYHNKITHGRMYKVFFNAVRFGYKEVIRSVLLGNSIQFTRFNVQSTRGRVIPKKANSLDIIKKSLVSYNAAKKALRQYKELSKNCDFTKEGIKVLYAAHQEPEAAILVEGGKFYTNYEAVKYIQSMLPHDAVIYYKDHDANFYYYDLKEQGNAPENRPSNFYDLMSLEKNIQFIPIEMGKKEIFEEIDAVATICGTIAIEASIYGTPSIVLGDPWYMESGIENLIRPETFKLELLDNNISNVEDIHEKWKIFLNSIDSEVMIDLAKTHHNDNPQPDRLDPRYLTNLLESFNTLSLLKTNN